MTRAPLIAAAVLALSGPACAQTDSTAPSSTPVSALPAASSASGSDLVPLSQACSTTPTGYCSVRATVKQLGDAIGAGSGGSTGGGSGGSTPAVGSVTAAMLASGAAAGNLGYTPPKTVNGASPNSSGAVTVGTAATPALGDNSTAIATTAAVAQRQPCLSILDYGGNAAGASANDAAWTAAVTANRDQRAVCVYFPPGLYKFSSTAKYKFASGSNNGLRIYGAGASVTRLEFASGYDGVQIVMSDDAYPNDAITVAGLSIITDGAGTGYSGLELQDNKGGLNTSPITIRDVAVFGADGPEGGEYWQAGIRLIGVSNTLIDNAFVTGAGARHGIGVSLEPRTSGTSVGTTSSIVTNVSNSSFYGLDAGFVYGNGAQGVTISTSQFTNVTTGIYVPAGGQGLDQLTLRGNQIAGFNTGLLVSSDLTSLSITGNYFLAASGTSTNGGSDSQPSVCIDLEPGTAFTITGNNFNVANFRNNTGAITVSGSSTSRGGVISGNQFYGFGSQAIGLNSSSHDVVVASNQYLHNTANVANAGSGNTVGLASQ